MSTLYEINQELLDSLSLLEQDENGEWVDTTTGEIIPLTERIEALQLGFVEKLENVVLYCKNLKADEEAIQKEIENLKERKERKEKRRKKLEEYMAAICTEKQYESPRYCLKFRPSEVTVVPTKQEDIMKLPECFRTARTSYSASKTAIKEALMNGEQIEGCMIQQKKNCSY